MNTQHIIQILRKIVWIVVFLAFHCIPIGGHGGAAPLFGYYVNGWPPSRPLEIASFACIAAAAFLLMRLVLNNDTVNGPMPSYGVIGMLLLSFIFVLIELSPLQKIMISVFLSTLVAAVILLACDLITLWWISDWD